MRSMQSVVPVHRVHAGIQLSRDQRLRQVQRKVSQMKFFKGYEAGEFFSLETEIFVRSVVFFGQGLRRRMPQCQFVVCYMEIW